MWRKILIVIVFSLLLAVSVSAQEGAGVSFTCGGQEITNGVGVVVVQMRSGFTYTATAVGLGDFDPIVAVNDGSGQTVCNDNADDAADYELDLPTTGFVAGSRQSAQIQFAQRSGQALEDVIILVGSVDSAPGEFVLMVEGMAATPADGAGDPFAVTVTPGMVSSGIPLSVYMIATTTLDPIIFHTTYVGGELASVTDNSGEFVTCDDAGDSSSCWGQSSSLGASFVPRRNGQRLAGGSLDAMLSLPVSENNIPDGEAFGFVQFHMAATQDTQGDYVLAFHAGTGGSGEKPRPDKDDSTPVPPADTGSAAGTGFSLSCDNGAEITNGVEVTVVQMRAGFTYTATAIGIGDFDPVLAVVGEDRTGLCSDNTNDARDYAVDLPTTGRVAASRNSAQIQFNQASGANMADVSLIVGGIGDTAGEFVLILEGMAVTSADNAGDPFQVSITPGMVNSGVPLTAYMISVTNALDPLFYRADLSTLDPITDNQGNIVGCDDAGNSDICWGQSVALGSSFVTRRGNQRLPGSSADAMLSIPLDGIQLPSGEFGYFSYLMNSYRGETFGDYVLAFHIGISGGGLGTTT